MFTALILICNVHTLSCETMSQRVGPERGSIVHETEDACLNDLAKGIKHYENRGMMVAGYDCHQWKKPKISS
jgi:hypothetical protein